MTAEEFVEALGRTAALFRPGMLIGPSLTNQCAGARAWAEIPRREQVPPPHSADPVLNLLAQYDLSAVIIWQFQFIPTLTPLDPGIWKVAERPTYEYFVERSRILMMYYKEDRPHDIGVKSSEFLDLLALYAERRVVNPVTDNTEIEFIDADFAQRALTISPHAAELDWFGEARRKLGRR
jgi:hypothetical protein